MLIDDLLYAIGQEVQLMGPLSNNLDRALMTAVRFQVDNVASYAYNSLISVESDIDNPRTCKEFTDDIQNHIPNVAPLAPIMWFEFGGLAKGGGKPATNRYGCLLTAYDRKQGELPEGIEVPENTRWLISAHCFANLHPQGLVNMRWVHYITVNDDGRFEPFARQWANTYEEPPTSELYSAFYNEGLVALLAICFAHCKGVEIQEHQPTRQVRRVSERSGKPVFTFHTIDIHPATRMLSTEGKISENGLAKALLSAVATSPTTLLKSPSLANIQERSTARCMYVGLLRQV